MAFLLSSQAQGVSGKNEQSTQTPWRGAQCSCIDCIGLRPVLLMRTLQLTELFNALQSLKTRLKSCAWQVQF